MNIQFLKKSQVPTPSSGQWYLFYDLDNGNVLTAKDADCDFFVMGDFPSVDTTKMDDTISDVVKKIVHDAGCALNKALITSSEYESIIDDLNYYGDVIYDPSTGGFSSSFTTHPTLFVVLTKTNALCNGGSTGTASVSVTGGTGPYVTTFTDLSNVAVNPAALPAGAYKVTVTDANGTVKTIVFIVTQPAALALTVNVSGGTASAVVTGGTSPYTYVWNDNLGTPIGQTTQTATGLTSGTYQVVVTDANGCTISDTNVIIS
jgi:hypothetical protein